jgi:hypothetical protein
MVAGATARSHAGFAEFTDQDEWFDAVGDVTTIDFTGFPVGTLITDQYADLGVLFTGGSETIRFNKDSFPPDQFGLQAVPLIRLEFTTPQAWIAVSFPGVVRFELSLEGQLLYTSSNFGGGGTGHFAGLVGDQLFDTVVIRDPSDMDVNIGDLYFGVPGPSTLGAFGLACVLGLGSRRRRSVSFGT